MSEYQETTVNETTVNESDDANKKEGFRRKRRAGRTILIKSNQEYECNYDGIISTADTENGSKFVVFDTIENSKNAFKSLKDNNIKAKYSYYKMFFKIKSELLENISYDDLKELVLKEMSSFHEDINILYFKLYTRQGKLTGSGDLVLDTKEDLDKLVTKRNLKLDSNGLEVRMFRFIMKNFNNEEQNERKQ